MPVLKKIGILLLTSALCAALLVLWRERHAPSSAAETSTAPSQAPSQAPSHYAELSRLLTPTLEVPALSAAAIGFCLLDAKGDLIFEHQARTAFIPASSLKTVTTATALEVLGPDFTFETPLRSASEPANGVITGDLVLVGSADPTFSLEDINSLVTQLKAKGVQRISGRVVGDGHLFSGTIYQDFWNWGDIGNGYGSGVSGLNLEHNRYTATFNAGASEGAPATFLNAQPEVPGVHWRNEVLTGPGSSGDGVVIHGGERTNVIHLRGTVPLGAENFAVIGAVPDPELFCAFHLRAVLLAVGIQVEGEAASLTDLRQRGQAPPESSVMLATHRSSPLIQLITSIHATSDNHETECLFRLLGARASKPPVTVIRDHWRARGLEFEGLRMEDGCGLARADFTRPLDLARLQYLVAHGPHGDAYKNSLLSKDDGALRWKGGAMSGIRTMTGYVLGASGQEYSFAFMVNHYTDAKAVSELREALIAAMRTL